MKIKYLGTAAFEGIPALFCSCSACINARKTGGKDIRTRSQAIIDDEILIDFPADTYMHFLQYGIDFNKFDTMLVTHSHSDHLYPQDLNIKTKGFTVQKEFVPLNIYVGESGKRLIDDICQLAINDGEVILHDIFSYKPFNVKGYTVIPIPASHDESSSPFVFVIKKGDKALFYGNDTGVLNDEVLDKIAQLNVKFDLISLDCTMGETLPSYYGHFNVFDSLSMFDYFESNGLTNNNCKKVITHFSHNHYVSHEYLQSVVGKHDVVVAYDGLEIEF